MGDVYVIRFQRHSPSGAGKSRSSVLIRLALACRRPEKFRVVVSASESESAAKQSLSSSSAASRLPPPTSAGRSLIDWPRISAKIAGESCTCRWRAQSERSFVLGEGDFSLHTSKHTNASNSTIVLAGKLIFRQKMRRRLFRVQEHLRNPFRLRSNQLPERVQSKSDIKASGLISGTMINWLLITLGAARSPRCGPAHSHLWPEAIRYSTSAAMSLRDCRRVEFK